ncbi:Smr/MutS family protein [Winogradskyella poriferorum]|uniref:Smr/MutS family protein n=1 Tax=Winogradskyella poriferorum TaxID=307627 RepID=UPI003D655FC5
MKIKVGDLVETIDDNIKGKVISVKSDGILVEDNDGFQLQFQSDELMLVKSDTDLRRSIANSDLDLIKKEKDSIKPKKKKIFKPKQRHAPKIVIDLHIHQLVDSTKGMTNFDMLNLQLNTAQRQLERAIEYRVPKIVFIHGVGEGVLRQELETLFRRYNNVEFYDADYKLYGLGATEVRIFQNINP